MKKSTRNITILFPVIIILHMALFYQFMTYDRNYTWSKEFSNAVEEAIENTNFKTGKSEEINPNDIQLPIEKIIKLHIQELLSSFNLMNYGEEFGQKITLSSMLQDENIICKSWCLSDYIIGVEIEYQNIDEKTFMKMKNSFEKQFSNYKIIWTKI